MKKKIKLLAVAFWIIASAYAQTDSIVKAKVLDDGSQDAEKFYNNGIADFASRNYQSALSNFSQAIKLKTNFERAYFNRGITKFELKDNAGAIADFDNAIGVSATADSYFGRAQAKYSDNNKNGASEDYSKAIDLKKEYAQAYYYRGGIKFENEDYKGAEEDFTQAIKYKSDYAYAYNDRASARRQQNNYEGAISDYSQALSSIVVCFGIITLYFYGLCIITNCACKITLSPLCTGAVIISKRHIHIRA